MATRVDITFYDSYSSKDENISIQINNQNFYLIFSLYYENFSFIDETIYYPKAYLAENGMKEILLEPCNIDKIDSENKSSFPDFSFNNHYCLSNNTITYGNETFV